MAEPRLDRASQLPILESGVPGAPVRWERRHPAGFGQATEDQEGKEGS